MRGNHENIPSHHWLNNHRSSTKCTNRSKEQQPSNRQHTNRANLRNSNHCFNRSHGEKQMSQLQAAKFAIDTRVNVKTVILKLLELSPMTDPELCDAYKQMSYIGQAPITTEQNIRTHRAQLHKLGLIHIVGTTKTQSGREARIWRKA